MEGLRTIKGRKHKSLEISNTLWMCVFGGSRAVSPLSISGISEVRANTSSGLRAAPGMPRDVAGLARTADGTEPKALLAPYPAEEMKCWPVSPRVGNVKNNHPSLIEPIAGAGWAWRIGSPMEAMSPAEYGLDIQYDCSGEYHRRRSRRARGRVMASVSRFLTKKLRLKVNEAKSAV